MPTKITKKQSAPLAKKARAAAAKFEFPAIEVDQKPEGPKLLIFKASAEEILKFSEVGRLGPASKGPQREQKEARVDAIAKFLRADPRNTIPTAVILSFRPGKAKFKRPTGDGAAGMLIISGMASIVDGQHRLYGIQMEAPKTEVPVVALLDADDVEEAFQFLVINNKSSKVPATHTKALLADMKKTQLAARLKGAKLAFDVDGIKDIDLVNSDSESPFYMTIDWTTTPKEKRIVQATAIEASLDYLGGIGIPEYDDRDVRRAIFLAIWKTIRAEWPNLWVEDSRLISKVGIVCMTRLIVDRITSWADSDELEIETTSLVQIETVTREKILKYMDVRFWTTPWAEKSKGGFDTAQGRDRVLAAITQLFRNGRKEIPWYTDIDIIDRVKATS